jgi:hypothetical protein
MPERFIYLLSDVTIVLLMLLYMVLSTVFGHFYSVNDIDHEYSVLIKSIGYQNFNFFIVTDNTLLHVLPS